MILQGIVGECENFIFDAFSHFKPMERPQCRCDMGELGSATDRVGQTVRLLLSDKFQSCRHFSMLVAVECLERNPCRFLVMMLFVSK